MEAKEEEVKSRFQRNQLDEKVRECLELLQLGDDELKCQISTKENPEKKIDYCGDVRFVLNFINKHPDKSDPDAYAFLHYNKKTSKFEIQSEYGLKPLAPYLDDLCSFTFEAAMYAISKWLFVAENGLSLEICCSGYEKLKETIEKDHLVPLTVSIQKIEQADMMPVTIHFTQPKQYGTRNWNVAFEVDQHKQLSFVIE